MKNKSYGKLFACMVGYVVLHFALSLGLGLVGILLPKTIESIVRILVFKTLFVIYAYYVASIMMGKRDIDMSFVFIFGIALSAVSIVSALTHSSGFTAGVFTFMSMVITYVYMKALIYGAISKIKLYMSDILMAVVLSFIVYVASLVGWAVVPVAYCMYIHSSGK